MRDIIDQLDVWYRDGTRFALATVVSTWSSSPRSAGASMAVSETGEVVGSVSGGCVEGAVYELAQQVLATGIPVRRRYGISESDVWEVGLTCGGSLEVFVELAGREDFPELAHVIAAHRRRSAIAVATITNGSDEVGARVVVEGGRTAGTIPDGPLRKSVVAAAEGMLLHGRTGEVQLGPQGQERMDDLTIFVEAFAPPPEMIVFGAIDFAAAVVRIGKFLGYYVTVCDARPVFATKARFADADEVVVEWPHRYLERRKVDERAVLCVLTHDPKFDVPLLAVALRTDAQYIGAMGNRRTHEDRLKRLREAGLQPAELSRLSSPIGLDLGGRTPEETAVSIAAEIIATQWRGTGRPLGKTSAPIHGNSIEVAAPLMPAAQESAIKSNGRVLENASVARVAR
ncbi:XshC-Cox1 family protein [Nocardioides sp. JQ2195]|uniref:XdhC family protein n=1 Tax=Nocardioides sp. JQ2195 TaxID=2592334 RepID=UPI00143E1BBC|nr:XdhC family protein [Nocardioides sp. JQ2195]QIX26969.1 XshC-Cox1 family protein [Nocardioides sp. JQ2195]